MRILSLHIAPEIGDFLHCNGNVVHTTEDINDLCTILTVGDGHSSYDVLLIRLSEKAGGILCPGTVRQKGIDLPIVAVAENGIAGDSERRADFLNQGGDYLLREPSCVRELTASLAAAVRRGGNTSEVRMFQYPWGELIVNIPGSRILSGGNVEQLTKKENSVLASLVLHPGKVLSVNTLVGMVYGSDGPESKTIDVFISKIRRKLNTVCAGMDQVIHTTWGLGFSFEIPGSPVLEG